ncbi:MAG: hypothetical protein RMI91_10220 [Gemmatales bacterium]|nr:hypothetical protein [Gemmatales bacterium]MDW7995017.1 hypothetical protein [Gemmatales bacterium]
MYSPQLLVNATFGVIWIVLAVFLLFFYRGPEHLGQFNLRTMGVLSSLLALYNVIRVYLEWRRLRQGHQNGTRYDRGTSPPAVD